MGGEPLTKDQLRKYVSDGDKWIKTLGRLNPEFSNSYDDALLIGKNLNEKDVQNLYFGQLEHTTYIDITEWFIEFVELCYKVADKNIKNDFDEQFIEDVLDFVDNIKNNADFLYTNTKYLSEKKNNLGYAIDRTYTGDFKMPQSVIQNIEQKLRFHQFYIDQTIFELKRNAYIEKLIKKEIAAKE